MSLCLANLTGQGLLIGIDGVVTNNAKEIVKNDMEKLFKITDNLAIFVSGEVKTNLEVIEMLKNEDEENFLTLEKANKTIVEACKKVYEKYRDHPYILGWEHENRNRDIIAKRQYAIPISLTVFFHDGISFYCTNFIPPFLNIESQKMKTNQTFIHGFKNTGAAKILQKSFTKMRNLQNDIQIFESCYRELEKEYAEIGGNTKYFLMSDDSFDLITEVKPK